MELDISADTTALCRVCMIADAGHLTNLHDTSSCGQPSLYGMLEAICAPVFRKSDIEDIIPGLPTKVCPPCRNAIVAAYKLHQQCIETDRRLSELLALKWELQGGEDVCPEDSNQATVVKEEPTHEPVDANVENEVDFSKEEQVFVERDAQMSSRFEESKTDNALNEESNQYRLLNKSVTKMTDNQKIKSNTGNIVSCSVCYKVFASRDSLDRHISQKWCNGTIFPKNRTCDICKKVLKSAHLMQAHRQMHDAINITSSNSTPAATQQQRAPEADKASKSRAEDASMSADDATVKFVKGILANQRIFMSTYRTSCNLCSMTFANSNLLRKHIGLKHHIYECGYCKKIFPTLLQLDSHKQKSHPNQPISSLKWHANNSRPEPKPFQCDSCEKSYLSAKSLRDHKRIHLSNCNDCGEGFQSKELLQEHKAKGICWGDLSRTCKLCNIIFDADFRYKEHCKETHSVGPVVCPECGRTFVNHYGYRQHIKLKFCKKTQA